MEWQDRGVVLGVRPYGETSVIVELLTVEYGRHLGLVQGGRSRRLRPVLQPGNAVLATWRARIEQHIGTYLIEGTALRAARIIDSALALHALNHLCGLARLLPEREPQPVLHAMLDAMLEGIEDRAALPLQVIQFELACLSRLGFGLDLTRCAATGTRNELHYVSPKSGRAVSAGAAGTYADRLLKLPPFLRPDGSDAPVTPGDLASAFRLTGHFLLRDVIEPQSLARFSSRDSYLAALDLQFAGSEG